MTRPLLAGAFFGAIFILALISRFWALDSWSLWGDEQYSWYAANLSLRDMWKWTAADLHPPLYYATLHWWVTLAGNSTESLRAPSATASAIAVLFAAYAAWRIGSWSLGGIAALLLILNPAHLHFAQEARMYPLASMFAMASMVTLADLLDQPRLPRALVYSGTITALIYTHYVGFVAAGVEAVILLVYGIQSVRVHRRWQTLRLAALALGLAAASYGPWWQYLFSSAKRGAADVRNLTWTNVAFNFRDGFGLERADATWPLFAIGLASIGMWGLWKRRANRMAVCVLGLALVPVVEIAISLVAQPVFDLKRMSPFIPALSIVSAVAVVDGGHMLTRVMRLSPANAGALAMLPLSILATFMFLGARDKYISTGPADWAKTSELLRDTNQPIYVWPAYNVPMLRYFTGNDADLRYTDRNEFLAAQDGFLPIPRTWPENRAALVFEYTRPQDAELRPKLQSVLDRYFVIDSSTTLPRALAVTSMKARSIADYNVDLVSADVAWKASSEGWLLPGAAGARFRVASPTDFNGDARVDASFTIHVEFRGPAPSITGVDHAGGATMLAATAGPGSDGWSSLDFTVGAGDDLINDFVLRGASEIRTIEVRRYEVFGASVPLRNRDPAGDWFVRPDGFLEPVKANACVTTTSAEGAPVMVRIRYLSGFESREAAETATVQGGRLCPSVVVPRMIVRSISVGGP